VTKGKKIISYAVLIIASVFSAFPLYWMLVSATNKSTDVVGGRLIPGSYLIQNWTALLKAQKVGEAMLNSFFYSILLTLISLFICSLAGYGFEICHTKGKDHVMSIVLLAMMVPFAATMIPLFQMFSKAGLLNTAAGFILPTISTPFLIMMFRQSARSFPHEMIDAARVDGLNEFQIFVQMFFPTMRSTYAAAMTITFMNAWNAYLWPKIIMTNGKSLTMPMLIANLKAGYVTDYGQMMLGVTLCSLPTIIVFFLLQKNFANGITGAVKG